MIAKTLPGAISFAVPPTKVEDAGSYRTWVHGRDFPSEKVDLTLRDLRPELEQGIPAAKQLYDRGYAVLTAPSRHLAEIHDAEGIKSYLHECTEILRDTLGCTRVISWNSVVRRSDPNAQLLIVEKQNGAQTDFIPTTQKQPPAGVAHVDQDDVWGKELCGKAAGVSADTFRRCQIVNFWRPLRGPVTQRPLAMADGRTLDDSDFIPIASQFGTGLQLHYTPKQDWGYIRHQTPDELIMLKCYDTEQGADGSCKYCAHVAAEVDGDEEGMPPETLIPRESVEVRLVALWE